MRATKVKSHIYHSLSLTLLFLAACGEPEHESSELLFSEIPANMSSQKAALGMGWNADSEIFVGRCIEGELETAGINESSVVFDNSMSQDQLMRALGLSFSAKGRYGVYSGRASAQFAATAREDSFSNVTIYRAQYDFENAMFVPNGKRSAVGEQVYRAQGHANSPVGVWERSCGHEYVSQITKGAQLIISARIDFLSEEDRREFNGRFSIKGPAWSAKAQLSEAAEKFKDRASVSISAYQQGGDVSQLSKAFSRVDESDDSSYLIRCSMIDIEACIQTLSQIIRYATEDDDSKNYFPAQIANNGADGGADILYLTSDYFTAGIFPDHDSLYRRLLTEERKEIEDKLERNIMFRNRLNAFNSMSKSSIDGIEGVSDLIDELREIVPHNQRLVSDAIRKCFDDLRYARSVEEGQEECEEAKNKLEEDFKDIDGNLDVERIICEDGSGFFGGPEWEETLFDDEGRESGSGTFTCSASGESEIVDVHCKNTHKKSEASPLTCEPKYCSIPNSNKMIFFDESETISIDNGKMTFTCNYPDTKGPKINCDNNYLDRNGKCLRACDDNHVVGDSWTVSIANGTQRNTCQPGGKASSSISCDSGYELTGNRCRPEVNETDAPCGSRPHGSTWMEYECGLGGQVAYLWECRNGSKYIKRSDQTGKLCGSEIIEF